MSKPSDDSFYVHLISNVAPHVFPDNSPAEFSTPLAHEIQLTPGAWEVATQQIMYPTHTSTTTAKDKILIHQYQYKGNAKLPYPAPSWKTIEDCTTKISFYPDYINKEHLADHLVTRVASSKWKDVIRLNYIKASKKFTLDLLSNDIVILLSADLQKLLGFKERHFFGRNSYWAWSKFDEKNVVIEANASLNIFLLDLTSHRSEKYVIPVVYKPLASSADASKKYATFETEIPHIFHDSLPDEYKEHEQKFKFGVYPDCGIGLNSGCIRFDPPFYQLKRYGYQHENKVLFYRFDANTTKELKLNKLYYYQDENYIETKLTTIPENTQSLKSITVEFFYITPNKNNNAVHLADGVYGHKVNEQQPTSIDLTNKKEITDPEELLPKFNQKSETHEYEFQWDKQRKRYKLNVTSYVYGIQMTKTLATILGFDSSKEIYFKGSHLARESPILNRDITSLYVYTNIVDPVFVGDVKAPLLLICPFKTKDKSKSVVHQLEFLNPTYAPVNRTAINQIDIGIYDDAGTLVPFLYGKTKLSLHFRRRRI